MQNSRGHEQRKGMATWPRAWKAGPLHHGAHGVVVSHPRRLRKALGSDPSVDSAAFEGLASAEGSGPLFACWDWGPRAPCSDRTVWPSGLRRWLKAPVREGVGSNPTAVIDALAPKR